jgi:hypothetical protein
MKKYTIEELKKQFELLNYEWSRFHIIGVRSKANLKNKFDDLIAVIDGDNIEWFPCTTNAGTHWLQNLLNKKGTAMLVPKQYVDTYKIGLHQGKYKALVQHKVVQVYRDGNKNDIAEEQGVVETGFFGINIHRANTKFASVLIDKWSAGCQVLSNPKDFDKLMRLCDNSGLIHFTYTLLHEF